MSDREFSKLQEIVDLLQRILHSMPHKSELRHVTEVRWLDNQDVMQLLHVSDRTLQRWRSQNILPFSKINGKIFYQESDVHQMLNKQNS